jgi:two-component system C4-dicarboxylate transport response regulator DctD
MCVNQTDVILVEDDSMLLRGASHALQLAGFNVSGFSNAEDAIGVIALDFPGIVVSDVCLGGMDGLALFGRTRSVDPELPVILITGHGDIAMAVQAMRDGAYDFIEKPFRATRLVEVTRRALDKRGLVLENRRLREALSEQTVTRVIGQSAEMERIRQVIIALAPTDVDILLVGETGTGKEVTARAIHQASGRTGNFVAVNCGALPESIFESEIFGHEPGAFTGAQKRRIGKIEHANNGTLFLDEIETMPPSLQVKLLRVLQEREVERLGGNEVVSVTCRVIAASKADRKTLGEGVGFRSDLYYRLSVACIDIPPLRERQEDILPLFQHFVHIAAVRYQRPVPEVRPEMQGPLVTYAWPGNVRELRNVADQMVLGLTVLPEVDSPGAGRSTSIPNLGNRVEAFERNLIDTELRRHNGNVTVTAEALQLPVKTLYHKLNKYNIDPTAFRKAK